MVSVALHLIWDQAAQMRTREGGNLPITCHVKLLVVFILLDTLQDRSIRNAYGL